MQKEKLLLRNAGENKNSVTDVCNYFPNAKKFAICICRYSNGSDLVMGCNDRISCKWNSIFHTIKRYCYGVNVNGRTVRLSENKHLTIGSCESFTAGLFCAKLAKSVEQALC